MMIHILDIGGPGAEPKDNTFDDIRMSEDFHTWQGNACTLPLPGGGNEPSGPGGKTVGEKH